MEYIITSNILQQHSTRRPYTTTHYNTMPHAPSIHVVTGVVDIVGVSHVCGLIKTPGATINSSNICNHTLHWCILPHQIPIVTHVATDVN